VRSSGVSQDVAHGTRRHRDAKLAQLASDPQVAPARVLAREAEGRFAHVPPDRRPALAAVRVGTAARNEPAMPGQERLRPRRERGPRAARKHPAERRHQDPVLRVEGRPPDLAAEDRQLVAEHEDLELLRSIATAEEHDEVEQATDDDAQD
jgi:hypothetical protein